MGTPGHGGAVTRADEGRPRIRPSSALRRGRARQREFRSTWYRPLGAVVVHAFLAAQLLLTTDDVLAISPRGLSGEKSGAGPTWETAGFEPIEQRSVLPPLLAWAMGAPRASAAPMV